MTEGRTMGGVPEPRTFRNWHAIAYHSAGAVILTAAFLASLTTWVLLVFAGLFALLLLGAVRQRVTVRTTEIEVQKFFRYRLVQIHQIDRISVHFSKTWRQGWWIRLHLGEEQVDTFAFLNLIGFRQFGTAAAAPLKDTPGQVRDLYEVIAERRESLGAH